jgi:hypothetical protein
MNISTKLITTQYIKDTTFIQELVKDSNIDIFIYDAQDKYIKPILGETLYNEVIQEVQANSGSTSGLTSSTIQTLVDYLQPTLAYYTVYESLPMLNYKFTNNGIVQRTGQNYQAITVQDLSFIRKDIIEKAKSREINLRNFLETNKSIYYGSTSITKNKTIGGFYF